MGADPFAFYRHDVLDRAEALGWPRVELASVGVLEGDVSWLVAVELASPECLIRLARALLSEAVE